jgi:hypothetical protein
MEKNLSPENNYEEIRKDIEESTEIDYLLDSLDIVGDDKVLEPLQIAEIKFLILDRLKALGYIKKEEEEE